MAIANTKRIEEMATTVLKNALLRCPFIDSYIDSNDKTPSWDGTVFVYKNEAQKKIDLIGRAPIQVKGTIKTFESDSSTFSCNVSDLINYYNDGGCVFFLVSVNPLNGNSCIYYSSLLVYDLKKILDSAGKQKSITIQLRRFPSDSKDEIASIFMSFVENSRKQMSFIGKKLMSISSLEKTGINIESLSFTTSGIGLNIGNIGNFISSHEFYLYAKPKGLDIEIPIDKVSNAIVSRHIVGSVCVKGVDYYNEYSVISQNGQSHIHIGKGIDIFFIEEEKKVTIKFNATGTLSDYILDGKCFISLVENKEITINGVTLPFHNADAICLDNQRESLRYYEDIKKMLDVLGVTDELQIDKLSKKDEENIYNLVNAILYNKKIGFSGTNEPMIYGALKIANLIIWIWATKKNDGNYHIENFFEPHQIAVFDDSDKDMLNPIPASHYFLLNREAFSHLSNMDYERIKDSIDSMEHHYLLLDGTTYLLLNILIGYDLQIQKNTALLDLADFICDWLSGYGDKIDHQVLKLNKLQIIKRRRNLSMQEIIELGKLTDESVAANIRCGAFLLLGEIEKAQQCFNVLTAESQMEFLKFPICYFGTLKME